MVNLKILIFVLLGSFLMLSKPCFATDVNGDDLLSLASLTKENATPASVTSMLGKPGRIVENNRKTWWYFTKGSAEMVICWNKKSETLEKVSFTSLETVKNTFDNRLANRLRSGITDISQALKLLGTPKDMTIKGATQEIHYAYRNSVLRLFFRDRTLVDFCLY